MAKTRQAALTWSQDEQQYLWRDERSTDPIDIREQPEVWFRQLATASSFSFQGREGQLTLLKEARPRGGDGYWYAYRRQGKRTAKKYAGRSADLSVARLEQVARTLQGEPEPVHQVLPPSPQLPLLVPKLHLPPLYSSLVLRERLLRLLDRALEHRLTLVSAPAGFGKTTLVRQWVAELSTQPCVPPIAWVSLDEGDNDPLRFWRYLMTACQTFGAEVAREALALLLSKPQPPFEASLTEMALTTFLNALAQCAPGGILLLDDYQAITSPRIQQNMTFFLTYLPASVHIVLITRSDPPFALAQLRARNELCELRTADLRFSLEETAAFLQQELSVALAPEIIQSVEAYVEGWAAGLRLLLSVLRESAHSQEIGSLLQIFASGQPALQDYFLTEVFHALPEPLQHFVLQTSVLTRVTGPLCAAITGERESERMLETVAHANLFLEPLGRSSLAASSAQRWYRYHGLWASAMRTEARRRLGEERLRELSAQASRWYEAHQLFAEAVESALSAQDYLRAAALIERMLQDPHAYSQANEYHTLYTWLEQLPEACLVEFPALCLGYARALLYRANSWRLSQATLLLLERLFQIAEACYQAEHDLPRLGEVYAFRSLAAWRRDDALEAARYARQALIWLTEEQHTWRALTLGVVGKAELLYLGHVNEGYTLLEEAYRLSEATDHHHFRVSRATVNMLARALFERGELHLAYDYCQGALQEAREGYVHSEDLAHALSGLARISYERNELEMARQRAEEQLAIGQSLALEYHEVQAILHLARIQHAQGETSAARQRLNALQARIPVPQLDASWPLSREIQTLQARLALAEGDLAAVQRWATGLDQTDRAQVPFVRTQEKLLLARWYLVQGREEVALELLHELERAAQETGHRRGVFEAQALLAQAYAAHEQPEQARHLLLTLLEQTCTEGYLRLFLDEGEAMAVLLRSLVLRVREQPVLTSLQSIIRAFPGFQDASATFPASLLLEPLSLQELRVLRLLVPGRSNAEIARELVVSVNTVRTHVQNIYRKLDAHNRAAAIEVARQLHLLK